MDINREVNRVSLNRRNIIRCLMGVLSIIFIFSITSDARSLDPEVQRNPSVKSTNNLFQNLKARFSTGIICEHCYDDIYQGIETIYGRTDKSGEMCSHCNIQDFHLTNVYARRKSSMCPNGCTYKDVEYLPTLYECTRLNERNK